MKPLPQTSKHERVAAHLREGMHEGRWLGSLPGVLRLSVDLGVSTHTVRRALRHLENEGLLGIRGAGRSRVITAVGEAAATRRPLRVAILRHDRHPTDDPQTSAVLSEIINSLEAAGHAVIPCKKSQIECEHDVRRIVSQLAKIPADAWVIQAGSRELLEWCSTQKTPCLALYGRTDGLALVRAGPDKLLAFVAATRHLLALGHRRIVLLVRESRRKPMPGNVEQAFLDELSAHGIQTGDYHLPHWVETPEGFSNLLTRLFQRTPPTALIIDETPRFFAAVEFLARHRIHVPEQVSLVSTDCDSTYIVIKYNSSQTPECVIRFNYIKNRTL